MHSMRNKVGSYAVVLPFAVASLAIPHGAAAENRTGLHWLSFRAEQHAMLFRSAGSAPTGSQGYLGIAFRDVNDERVGILKLKEPRGAEITHVDHDGPAGKAGLREHDVVLQINGQAIEGEEQLRRVLREIPSGRSINIILSRDGQPQAVSAQMADRATVEREAWEQRTIVPEPPPQATRGNGFLGGHPLTMPPITAAPDPLPHNILGTVLMGSSYTGAALELIGPQLAQFFGSQGGNGLLVRSVDPNSPAATAGLRAGDVVVRANAIVIAGVGEWARLVRENKGRPLSVVVVRDKQEQSLTLVPDSKKRSSVDFRPMMEPSAEQAQRAAGVFPQMN